MIFKNKVLVEIEEPTITGQIYSKENALQIIKDITENDIKGIVCFEGKRFDPENIDDKALIVQISNPFVIVDESTFDEASLLLTVDVNIDTSSLTDEQKNILEKTPFRLSMCGLADMEDEKIINYKIKYVNIEFVKIMV